MKKALMIGGGILLVLIIIGAAGGNKSNTNTITTPNSNSSVTTTTSEPTSASSAPTAQETLTISKSVARDKGYGIVQVDGEVKNNDSKKRTATLKATFYDKDGNIMGTAVGAVNEIAPAETKTFSLMSTDKVTGYKEMKVQVDTMF